MKSKNFTASVEYIDEEKFHFQHEEIEKDQMAPFFDTTLSF